VRRGERFELGDDVPVPAAAKQRLGPGLQRGEPLLFQAGRLGPRGRRVVQAGQGGPAPQPQRLVEQPHRGGRVAVRQRRVPLGRQPLEPPRVQLIRVQPEQVPGRPGDQAVGLTGQPQRLAQPGQPDLQTVSRPGLARPQAVTSSGPSTPNSTLNHLARKPRSRCIPGAGKSTVNPP
jgi:hypothetical protein